MNSRLKLMIVGTLTLGITAWGLVRLLPPEPFAPPQSLEAILTSRPEIQKMAQEIDLKFAQVWQQQNLTPAPRAPDLTVARRLSLALAGTIPSIEEIRAFEKVEPSQRLDWWLAHLLEDRRTSDYLAERLARIAVGVEDGPFILYRRHRLVSWLSDQLYANRPYDEIVRELVSAEGIWTSKPEVNFITVTVDPNNEEKGPDEQKLAARVSRAFLGVRLDCVQCHDDLFGKRWKQRDFHQLAAFFAPAEMSLTGLRDNPKLDYQFRYLRRDDSETIPPQVPFHRELLPQSGPPRERLGQWITHPENRAFARTTVNRLWALLFNRPLHKPIDDIPLEGPFPPGMELLAEDFIAHHFDLQRLIRIIASTRIFQLDSRSADPEHPIAAQAETHLAAYPLTRLRPEEMAGSILQSSNLRTLDAESHVLVRLMRFAQQKDFVKRFGDLGEDEFDEFSGTLPQRLILMNGKLVHERTKEDLTLNASARIGKLAPNPSVAVESAYLATLTRRPTSSEAAHFKAEHRKLGSRSSSSFMEDLFWTLINSTEYSWNH